MDTPNNHIIEKPSFAPIGVFDSGVGGLSIVRAIQEILPEENILYFADQAHVPYGGRSLDEVREISSGITQFLLTRGVKLIVIACNTASAASLHYLRDKFPGVSFVGMEPALKPAALSTKTGNVGVLATPTTFQSSLYASLISRFASGIEIYQDTCPGLVNQIENGEINNHETIKILESALNPMVKNKVDRIVLGCTHYPFVISLIQDIVGEGIKIIDPSPAIARQVKVILNKNQKLLSPDSQGRIINNEPVPGYLYLVTSGDEELFRHLVEDLIGLRTQPEKVVWGVDIHR